MSSLSAEERLFINTEVLNRGKKIHVAYLLAIFLGLLGAHRFYLRSIVAGVIQLIFSVGGFIFVGASAVDSTMEEIGSVLVLVVYIWIFVDLFLIPRMVRQNHKKVEQEVISEIRG